MGISEFSPKTNKIQNFRRWHRPYLRHCTQQTPPGVLCSQNDEDVSFNILLSPPTLGPERSCPLLSLSLSSLTWGDSNQRRRRVRVHNEEHSWSLLNWCCDSSQLRNCGTVGSSKDTTLQKSWEKCVMHPHTYTDEFKWEQTERERLRYPQRFKTV